jgi:hypothetical protein
MSFQKFATVNIIGGLGNQLHQFAFIKYLENKGFKLRVNLDWYEIDEHKDGTIPRKFELNIKNFDLILSNKDEYNKFERFNYLNNSKKFKKFYESRFNFLYKYHYGNEFSEDKLYINNIFNGYWQNKKYLINKKSYLLDGLSKHDDFKTLQKDNNQDLNTMVHIRRGDYLSWGEDLPLSYFEDSLRKLKSEIGEFKYNIYTDGEINQKSELYKFAENIFNDTSESSLSTLKKMTNYDNFIISNSSLSFFGAFLSESKKKRVIYPKPWFKSVNFDPYVEEDWNHIEY